MPLFPISTHSPVCPDLILESESNRRETDREFRSGAHGLHRVTNAGLRFAVHRQHGQPLPKGWIIPHLNGVKSYNRPHNLVALTSKKHYIVLEAKAKRIQELEGLLNKNQQQLL